MENQHKIECQCGCVPKIPSLFEMAEKRKQYLESRKAKQQTEPEIIVSIEQNEKK
jgi:hypothetical protein